MLDGYEKESFEAQLTDGGGPARRLARHDVYLKGEGPIVVLIQELPGIGPETLRLADLFFAEGFSVALPHLFGPLGRVSMAGNTARVFCMRREFHLFAKNASSPIAGWLKALCAHLKAERGAPGVAVIGMCLTGNFALSLVADASVLAGVASQPAMPILSQSALHMSAAEIAASRDRLDQIGPMLALRFDKDPLCTAAKFAAIDKAFNGDAERVRTRVLPGKGHSVLTLDFVDEAGHPTREAFDEVVAYFRAALT
ncbi:MAG: dienelactone hydrolase family protein [Pseudomonadota bacterium]